MNDLSKIIPLSVTIDPGTSVTIALPTTLITAPGSKYLLRVDDLSDNHTSTEEVVLTVGTADFAGVDRYWKYITSQMLYNQKKRCPGDPNSFVIEFVVSPSGKNAVKFISGLAPRKTTIAVVVPPTV